MSVPQDASKNPQMSSNKEQKVIVLSMKNMPSFKFDVTKSLLTSNQDNGQSVFSFKPQQLLQSPPSSHHTIQVTAQPKVSSTNIQVVSPQSSVQKITGNAGTILIRAQSPTSVQKQPIKPQQLTMVNHPNIKIQEAAGLRKVQQEFTMKSQSGHTVVLPSMQRKQIIVPATSSGANQTKIYQIPCQPQKILPKQHVKLVQSTVKESPKPIPILPKPDQKIVVQQQIILPSAAVIVQQSNPQQQIKQNVITIPVSAGSSFMKYNVSQHQSKWAMPTVSNISFPPALTPIQPKVSITPNIQQKIQTTTMEKNENVNILMEVDENDFDSDETEVFDDEVGEENNTMEQDEFPEDEQFLDEKTPEKTAIEEKQQFLDVKRIIEGDDGLQSFPENSSKMADCVQSNVYDDNNDDMSNTENISAEINESCEHSKNTTTSNNNNNNNNNSMLLCEEKLSSITPEESPENSEKSKDQVTPMHTNVEIAPKNPSIEDVKKNLKLDLIAATTYDNSEKEKAMEIEENESVVSDDQSNQSSMIESKKNSDDSPSKSEMLLSADQATTSKGAPNKPRRNRKPKNPTVNTSLGLPYKPPQPSNRKKKVEKKVELEMDFHDPLNKILWEDGIGGLNNCNKLFGFNEFGLIEVLTKKDATAKLKLYEENPSNVDDNCNFKFRKIVDPQDQYVCIICSKLGTVRDFFSPECCSESCHAITKRKTTEFNSSTNNSKDENIDSGLNTPTDAKKVIFEGEMVTLQQLQQHLLEQTLPESKKRKHQGGSQKKLALPTPEVKFSWDTYLTPKSVPAPENFFIYTSKTATTHFRVGMKLEAIDPKNQHMICVCTVEEKLGCRMKLHFDGYPASHDFWTNSDSLNIFPVGYCSSTGRKLNVPPRWSNKKFDWTEYFDHTNSVGAQPYMFPRLNQSTKNEDNPLTVGMKLEVMHDDTWYAATIIDVLNSRILIRFDGIYEDLGCFWFDIHSQYLRPCGGNDKDSRPFNPPFVVTTFAWSDYLRTTKAIEAPKEFFNTKTSKPHQFEPGMKLEVVDRVNPQLVRPATILCQNEQKIQVIFDGFDINYAYWVEIDSEDLHPINYCKETEHPIEHPAGASKLVENSLCSMNGCRGIGNGLFVDRYFHDNPKECPYNAENWTRLIEQKENTRMDYKPNVRRSKNATNDSRSLLLQNPPSTTTSTATKKYKKEKQEVKEEPQIEDETSNDGPKTTKRRARKRKAQEPKIQEVKEETPEAIDEQKNVKIRVVKHFIEDYGPQINYAYNLWTKNSKVLEKASITDDDLSENPMKWNVDDVCTFLVKFCDEETTAKFYAQKIDGEALLSLCQKDLVTLMNIKIGPAIKIYNRILWLRQEVMTKFTEF